MKRTPKASAPISDVTETAKWVATYRARESVRPDALFHDSFAARLAGERGREIADSIGATSPYTEWALVMRTRIIDDFLRSLVFEVDTVLNLGAGCDARPYRLDLPAKLRWIEVDHPSMVRYKAGVLAGETPRCHLEAIELDLANREERAKLLDRVAGESKSCLVLTEGVLPYLTNEAVGELARDLRARPSFRFWIAEYMNPQVVRHLHALNSKRGMEASPIRFQPGDWSAFFREKGWVSRDARYVAEESIRLGRKIPGPLWAKLARIFLLPLIPAQKRAEAGRFSGYVVYEPA